MKNNKCYVLVQDNEIFEMYADEWEANHSAYMYSLEYDDDVVVEERNLFYSNSITKDITVDDVVMHFGELLLIANKSNNEIIVYNPHLTPHHYIHIKISE